jgi:hypothetical protein
MFVKISVIDVLGGTINNYKVFQLENSGNVINSYLPTENEVTFDWDNTNILSLRITHPIYFDEELILSPNASYSSNNTCRINKTTFIDIVFTLSRVREAPTKYFSEETLTKMDESPNAILLQKKDERYNYRELFFGPLLDSDDLKKTLNFKILDYPILDNPNGQEWQRLRHRESSPNPSTIGRFRWVEYKFNEKTYIIGVWVPKNYSEATHKDSIDYFVFYTPTTAGAPAYTLKKNQKPPYGLREEYREITINGRTKKK